MLSIDAEMLLIIIFAGYGVALPIILIYFIHKYLELKGRIEKRTAK